MTTKIYTSKISRETQLFSFKGHTIFHFFPQLSLACTDVEKAALTASYKETQVVKHSHSFGQKALFYTFNMHYFSTNFCLVENTVAEEGDPQISDRKKKDLL